MLRRRLSPQRGQAKECLLVSGVPVSVAGDLRNGRRDFHLLLTIEMERLRDGAGAVAAKHHVRISVEWHLEQHGGVFHGRLVHPSPFRDDHGRVIPLPTMITVDKGRDDARVARNHSRILCETPPRTDAVRVHNQHAVRLPAELASAALRAMPPRVPLSLTRFLALSSWITRMATFPTPELWSVPRSGSMVTADAAAPRVFPRERCIASKAAAGDDDFMERKTAMASRAASSAKGPCPNPSASRTRVVVPDSIMSQPSPQALLPRGQC